MTLDAIVDGLSEITCDVLVIGGGTAGPMAALKAKRRNPKAKVILLEKANVKRSGAISMGMDGLNNAVIPGHATPEQYTKEITIANDGIVNQKAVLKYAERCYSIIEELDSFGIRFQKNENGDFAVKKVHHLGTYVLPMPNGETVKKALYRQLRRAQLLISNRYIATRLLTGKDGRVAGAIAVNTRTAEFLVIRAKAVILCMGAAGRLGLPTSGYLYGTYENATNSGDGYAMAYHAGAKLANLECFQINPLIKDYNGPACAYVAGPFGAYTANNEGARFIECDYWSGQMMLEFYRELQSGKGPVFLKLNHLHENTIAEIETILHKVERPSRGQFHEGRGTDYRSEMIEMHISEIGFCSGHSASGVFVDEFARTTVPGLYAAGDMASVPHSYMLGAFTNGSIAGEHASDYAKESSLPTSTPRTSPASATACWRRPGARTASRRTRSSTRRAASSTTTCSRRRCRANTSWPGALCRSARGSGNRHDGAQRARADARARSLVHPRLRRHGRRSLAVPRREPLGALSSALRLRRAR